MKNWIAKCNKYIYMLLSKIYKGPQLDNLNVNLLGSFPRMDDKDREHKQNIEELNYASIKLQKDALQKNITIMHRTLVISIFALIISVIALSRNNRDVTLIISGKNEPCFHIQKK